MRNTSTIALIVLGLALSPGCKQNATSSGDDEVVDPAALPTHAGTPLEYYKWEEVQRVFDMAKQEVSIKAAGGPRKVVEYMRMHMAQGAKTSTIARSIDRDATRHIYQSVKPGSYMSGVRAWGAHIVMMRVLYPQHKSAPFFPVTEELILRWPPFFRNKQTANNYKTHLM